MATVPLRIATLKYNRLNSTWWPKIGTLSMPYNFVKYLPISNVFHCQNREQICNSTTNTKDPIPHFKCVATLPCEMPAS